MGSPCYESDPYSDRCRTGKGCFAKNVAPSKLMDRPVTCGTAGCEKGGKRLVVVWQRHPMDETIFATLSIPIGKLLIMRDH